MLMKWFRRNSQAGNIAPKEIGNTKVDMSNEKGAGFWYRCWLAMGAVMKEAHDKKESLSFRQFYFRAVKKYDEIEQHQKLNSNEQHKELNP